MSRAGFLATLPVFPSGANPAKPLNPIVSGGHGVSGTGSAFQFLAVTVSGEFGET